MLSDYYRIFLVLLCGGCKVIATKKISKTAYQRVKVNTKNCPRHCHVWSLLGTGNDSRGTNSGKTNFNLHNCILLAMSIMLTIGPAVLAAPATATAALSSVRRPAVAVTVAPTRTHTLLRRTLLSSSGINGHNGTASVNATSSNSARLRKRHSKRHSNWYDYDKFNESSALLEWANPCNGLHVPNAHMKGGRRARRKNPKQIYNLLKKSATNEFVTLNGNQQDIDISDMQIWSLHNYTYKFLPKLKLNSTIALKRWYRNMQTYVGSFAYLRRVQLRWDHARSQRDSGTADELKHLMLSSRRMLCELESAINNTLTVRPRDWPLLNVTRAAMNKRLTLRTKRREKRTPGLVQEADSIDLKFVKNYYYEYLETMWKLLRKNTKRKGQAPLSANHKAFNEVDKPKSLAAAAATSASTRMRGYSRRHSEQHVGRRGGAASSSSSSSPSPSTGGNLKSLRPRRGPLSPSPSPSQSQ